MKLPRFTLRDLFWLVLVCACLCGWWAHYSYMRWDRQNIERAIKEAHYGLADDLPDYYLFPAYK